jgi:hypothetical protein
MGLLSNPNDLPFQIEHVACLFQLHLNEERRADRFGPRE